MERMLRAARIPKQAFALDVFLAGVFAALIVGATTGQDHNLGPGQVLFIGLMAAPLGFRRVWPLGVLAVTTVVAAAYGLLGYPGGPIYTGVIFAVYTVGTRLPRNQALIAAGASMAVVFAGVFAGDGMNGIETPIHLLFVSWGFAVVFIGDAARNRGRYVESLKERARQAEETRDEEARRRVAEERVRIARDIHDAVGHSLATITVQAAAGAKLFESEPERAFEALTAIRETSKHALRDLGATLNVLRPGEEAAPREPSPGVADFAALLRAPATAGIDVKTEFEGEPYPLPGAVDVAAYRILQESLTNVIRHAKASCAEVAVRYEPEFMELEVRDDGAAPVRANGHGHGLTGMRERAESLGGSFTAGPLPGGGYRVWTRLPTAGGT